MISFRLKKDWKYVATVLDRLFLWIFTLAVTMEYEGRSKTLRMIIGGPINDRL